jgi:hypothetical protein
MNVSSVVIILIAEMLELYPIRNKQLTFRTLKISEVVTKTESPLDVIFSNHLVHVPLFVNALLHVSLKPFYPVT